KRGTSSSEKTSPTGLCDGPEQYVDTVIPRMKYVRGITYSTGVHGHFKLFSANRNICKITMQITTFLFNKLFPLNQRPRIPDIAYMILSFSYSNESWISSSVLSVPSLSLLMSFPFGTLRSSSFSTSSAGFSSSRAFSAASSNSSFLSFPSLKLICVITPNRVWIPYNIIFYLYYF